jgi:hypothetical protein
MPTTFAEWVTIIGLPLTVAQTIYVALTYHSSTVAQAARNPPIPGADYMTDEHGIKSHRYTIREGIIHMTVDMNKEFCSYFHHAGGAEMIVVLLPKQFPSEQITSISSIETMRGKVIAHPGWPIDYPGDCANLK